MVDSAQVEQLEAGLAAAGAAIAATVAEADKALYAAKAGGRGRIVLGG